MDAYLASRELKDTSHFYLNFNFEILNGCKFHCRGCHVETNAQTPIEDQDFINLDKLLNSFTSSFYKPFIAFVGPTDFLSAENFISTFSQENIINIIHRFKRLSIQTTYLDIKIAQQAADVLNKHYSDMELEINIVIDPAKIMDTNYLRLIEINKAVFISLLKHKDVRSFGIMNVYDYDKTKIADLLRDYDFMHKRVEHLFETTIDYNFSMGRNKDLSNEDFLKLTFRIKNLFDTAIATNNQAEYLRFSFGKLNDSLIERQYNYRNGNLYYSPLLYERFVSFRDAFKVPLVDYTASEIERFEMQLQMQQYAQAPNNDECETCTFVATCIDRGILHLMSCYETTECLVAKKSLFAVNTMGPHTAEFK